MVGGLMQIHLQKLIDKPVTITMMEISVRTRGNNEDECKSDGTDQRQ